MDSFYVIATDSPTRYTSLSELQSDLEIIASRHRGKIFYILKTVGTCVAPTPPLPPVEFKFEFVK